MATPSASLVESLIGAIPIEEGAALVARVGERATITARSGSIEVGSVALTVEAMDDLIAQVLPPDQLESLQENGTVHFEFKPLVIGGDFAVLAASTPGDRWLEIRRRSTATGTATAAAPEAVRAGAPAATSAPPAAAAAPVPAPAPALAPVLVSDDADVAQLLSRFHTPETEAMSWETTAPAAAPDAPVLPPSITTAEPPIAAGFDLDLLEKAPATEPEPPALFVRQVSENDDLTIPATLDFPAAKSDFDLDDLSLPDTLPGPTVASFETEAPADSDDSDHTEVGEPESRGMSKLRFSKSKSSTQPRRSVVVLSSAVLGIVVLCAGGWYAAQRYLSTPSADVAPLPAPAPRKPVEPKAAAANSPGRIPTTAATSSANVVAQTPHAAAAAPKPVPARVVARANTEATTSKPRSAPAAAPAATPPPVATKAAAPASTVPREGFAIQVAAVLERSEADRIVARLVNEGYSGYAIRGQGSAAAYFRVRVGAFKDREAAEAVAARLERSEGVKPWIVKETP